MRKLRYAAAPALLALCASVAGCQGGQPASASGGGTFTTIDEYHSIKPGAPMNPFNDSGSAFLGYDEMRLGWFKYSPTDNNAFWPGVAASWDVQDNGQKVILHLQPKGGWSDGKPLTAQDVKTSIAIAFTQGTAQSMNLGTVKAVDDKTVECDQIPGQNNATFLHQLLGTVIVPDSVYGSQLPSDIWSTITASQYTGNDQAKAAAATKAQSTLTALGKKIAAFAPQKDVSAGPFVIQGINPGEAVLAKNTHFYAVDNVHPDKVVLRNYSGNQQIWGYLESGQLDFAPYTAMPTNVLNQILAEKGNQRVDATSYVAAALGFNESVKPLDSVDVRRAIAEIVDRSAVQKVGEPVSGTASKYTTGMIDSVVNDWMSTADISKLKTYDHNTADAAKLLQQAGLTKGSDGKWRLPNGQPWTLDVWTVNGFSDWIAAAKVISSELTSFGIPSQPKMAPDYATYQEELAKGKYPLGFWLIALGPDAYSTFARIYGEPDGYNVVGDKVVHYPASAQDKGNWIGGPTSYQVPGGGTIDPGQLTYELSHVPVAQQKDLVTKLALVTNDQLPVYTLWNYINVQFVNNTRFTDFPSGDGALNNSPGVWMQLGYVKPKS